MLQCRPNQIFSFRDMRKRINIYVNSVTLKYRVNIKDAKDEKRMVCIDNRSRSNLFIRKVSRAEI